MSTSTRASRSAQVGGPTTEASPRPAVRPRWPHRLRTYAVAAAAYLLVSIWMTGAWHHGFGLDRNQFLQDQPDPTGFVFFLRWWPWAILHDHNPFVVRGITWPAPYDAAWLTSVPGPALLGAPVTLLFGPIVTWNLYLILAPVASAFAMLAFLELLGAAPFPAGVGGFLFGFSAYEVGQLQGHLHLIVTFPVPLLALLLVGRLRGFVGSRTFIAATAALATFLVYTSLEITATATVFGIIAAALFAIWYHNEARALLHALWRDIAKAVGLVVVLSLPLLWYLASDLSASHELPNSPTYWSTDLLNFVIPTPTTALGGSLLQPMTSHFTGNSSEWGGYVGIVALLLTTLAIVDAVRSRRRWAVPLAIWTIFAAVATLGPYLHVDGVITRLPLPWWIPAHLPLLEGALPNRLMLYVSFAVAVWLGLWGSWAKTPRARAWRYGSLLLAVAVALPSPPGPHMVETTRPPE